MTMFRSVAVRLWSAISTPPRAAHLPLAAREAAWLLPLLLVLGFAGGLMRWQPAFGADLLKLALVAIVAPAIGEELVFRALLLPLPQRDRPFPWIPVLLSTAAFVLWHPLQALVFGPHWQAVVLDPWFLAAVAAFGLASSRLYWATGSIWPSAALHWIVVVTWKALLAGPSPWIGKAG